MLVHFFMALFHYTYYDNEWYIMIRMKKQAFSMDQLLIWAVAQRQKMSKFKKIRLDHGAEAETADNDLDTDVLPDDFCLPSSGPCKLR